MRIPQIEEKVSYRLKLVLSIREEIDCKPALLNAGTKRSISFAQQICPPVVGLSSPYPVTERKGRSSFSPGWQTLVPVTRKGGSLGRRSWPCGGSAEAARPPWNC